MKKTLLTALVILILLLAGCTNKEEEAKKEHDICKSNLRSTQTACLMFQLDKNVTPENLKSLPASYIKEDKKHCPAGELYKYERTEDNFMLYRKVHKMVVSGNEEIKEIK